MFYVLRYAGTMPNDIPGKRRALKIYIPPQLLWASAHGTWVISSEKVLAMHQLVTYGHRFFWGSFTILVVSLRSLGHLKVTITNTHGGYISIEL